MRRRADQLLAGFADGDAISHAALALRSLLRGRGLDSDIFVDPRHVSPSVRAACRPLADYVGRAGDLVLHHYSIASPAVDAFTASSAARILVYHNITPAEFFDGQDDRVASQLREARARLPDVAARCRAVWAVSEFNATELRAAGVAAVRVFPLLFDPPTPTPDDPEVAKKFAQRQTTVLTVGRIAPNKHLEELIEAFHWYHKTYNHRSRLVIVGSERSCPRYAAMLRMQVADLNLPCVGFEGFASPTGLPTYYRHADLFVSTSRHEGYCLPLIEAMHHGVPVLAHATGGIPEALDGSGCMFTNLPAVELAGLMHRLISDDAVRSAMLASQRRRLEALRRRDPAAELDTLLRAI